MYKKLSYLTLIALLLVACSFQEPTNNAGDPGTAAPATVAAPEVQTEADVTQVPLPTLLPTPTESSEFAADVLTETESEELPVLDPVIQEADRLLCEEIAASEAEIKEMVEQGLDVTELIEALDELRDEVGTCLP